MPAENGSLRLPCFTAPVSIFIWTGRETEIMEAAPNGPGLPKWNTFNYGMVCFYSIGLHASISLPYYMVKYSGKWGMHALGGGFCLFFVVLNCKSVLFQRDWRLSHRWCWIISCRKIDRILIRLRWLFSSYLSILHFILKLWIVIALGKHFISNS